MQAGTWRALRHRDFSLFFGGALISNIGTWMQGVAQSWLVLELTGSAAWLGTVGFVAMVPSLLLAPLSGVVADRVDRRRFMLALQAIMMLCALLLGLLTRAGQVRLWHVVALVFGNGVAMAFNGPSFSASIKDLVGLRDLPSGVGLISSQFHLSRAFGPLLAAGLISTIGLSGCFLLNAASFLAVILALCLIRPARAAPAPGGHPPVLHALREGVRYARTEPVTRWLLISTALTSFLGLPLATLMPLLADRVFRVGAQGLGYLNAAAGAGALLGALLSAGLGTRLGWRRSTLVGGLLFAAAVVIFSRTSSFPRALCILVAAGMAQVVLGAVGMTTVQSSVPDRMRGRVMSLYGMAFMGAMTIGSLSAGWLAHAIGAQATLLGNGVLLGVVVLIMQAAAPRGRGEAQAYEGVGAGPRGPHGPAGV